MAPKCKKKAKTGAKAKPKPRPDRGSEFKKRWMEKRLEGEAPESLAVKTWNEIRTGKALKEQREEFLEKHTQAGDFRFVAGLKWNTHLDSDETGQLSGWLTEAMIYEREAKNSASTKAVIAHATANGLVKRDEVRNTNLYYYAGIEYDKATHVTQKGTRSNMDTGNRTADGMAASSTNPPTLADSDLATTPHCIGDLATTPKASSIGPCTPPPPLQDTRRKEDKHEGDDAWDRHEEDMTEQGTDEDDDKLGDMQQDMLHKDADELGYMQQDMHKGADKGRDMQQDMRKDADKGRDMQQDTHKDADKDRDMQPGTHDHTDLDTMLEDDTPIAPPLDADAVIDHVTIFMQGQAGEPWEFYMAPFRPDLTACSESRFASLRVCEFAIW